MTAKPSTASRIAHFVTHWLMTVQGGWLLMLAVGIVHHEWIPACPTIGFWWSLLLVILLKWTFAGSATADLTSRAVGKAQARG